MKKLLKFIIPTILAGLLVSGVAYGVSTFNSNQVGTTPVNGYYLKTNGTTSTWAAVATGSGSTTTINSLLGPDFTFTAGTNLTLSTSAPATLTYSVADPLSVTSFTATNATITNATISNMTVSVTGAVTGNLQVSGAGPHYFSNGNVGIGTTGPGEKLDVSGNIKLSGTLFANGGLVHNNSADNSTLTLKTGVTAGVQSGIVIKDSWNGTNNQNAYIAFNIGDGSNSLEKVRINNQGNVGIGTTSPGSLLQLGSGNLTWSADAGGNIGTSQSANRPANVWVQNMVDIAAGNINMNASGNVRIVGQYQFYNSTLLSAPADGEFKITNNAGTVTPFIVKSGNVGIGTTNPGAMLSLYNNTTTSISLSGGGGVGSITQNQYNLSLNSTVGMQLNGTVQTFAIGGVEKVRIDTNGNVGIGTTGPDQALQVNGNIHVGPVSGNGYILYANNSVANEMPAGARFTADDNTNFSVQTAKNGAAGKQVVFSYYNGSNWYSALEYANVASGFGNLALMKSGGNVGIGTTGPTSALHIQAAIGATNFLKLTDTTHNQTASIGITDYLTDGSPAGAVGPDLTLTADRIRMAGILVVPNGSIEFPANLSFNGGANSVFNGQFKTIGWQLNNNNTYILQATINGDTYVRGYGGTNGNNVQILGGVPTGGNGGGVVITGAAGTGTNSNGGNVVITAGANTGSGIAGNIQMTGNVGIGTTSPSSKLQVYGNLSVATSSVPTLFVNTATQKVGVGTSTPATDLVVIGTITQTNQLSCSLGLTSDATGAINGCVASDIRLKKNILDLSFNANILNQITPVTYYWKYPATKDKNQHAGFVAQDVKKVFPQAVVPAGSGYLGVDSNSMLAYLWKFTQVFNKQFTDFKTSIVIRMNEQDKKIQSQQKQLDKLQQQINMLLEERAKGK